MDNFCTKVTEIRNGYILQYKYEISRRHITASGTVYFKNRNTMLLYLKRINQYYARLESLEAHKFITKLLDNYK